MADVLFIKPEDVKRFTALNGNVDESKYIPFVKIAQDIHVLNYLGENLFDKLKADITANTLSGKYYELVNDYLKYMLLHWSMVEYMPFSGITINNKGLFRHTSENSESVSKGEMEYILLKEKSIAEGYTNKMISFINKNINDLPEYKDNSAYERKAHRTVNYGGWYL